MINFCFIQVFTDEEKEFFKTIHTKQLLNKLRDMDHYSSCSWCQDEQCFANTEENRAFLKSILATRPHIMNKQESKEYRKAKKKKGN